MYPTLQAQIDTETVCKPLLAADIPSLQVDRHVRFLLRGLQPLSAGYVSLDAARPWLFYWCLNGLALLPGTEDHIKSASTKLRESVKLCQNPEGGFGGGFGQISHLAPTYAVILSLAIIGGENNYDVVDRKKLYSWIMSLKQESGGFAIQRDGEVDARAAYLALSVASLLDIMTPEMTKGTLEWLSSCQRYEGGLSGVHNAEAHGGLAFCALAAICILGSPKKLLNKSLDLASLLDWLTSRQMTVEGGYSGRTNKLVDGCYSWWVGGEFTLVEAALDVTEPLYDRRAISQYILSCCQTLRRGGLRDKPGKEADYYHTCYCLAGLSAAQNQLKYDEAMKLDEHLGWESFCWRHVATDSDVATTDLLAKIHPIYAVPWGQAEKMRAWAVKQPSVTN